MPDPITSVITRTLVGDLDHETADKMTTVIAYVQRQITCEITGQILDVRRAVVIHTNLETPKALVMSADGWEKVEQRLREGIEALDGEITEIIDGRELPW